MYASRKRSKGTVSATRRVSSPLAPDPPALRWHKHRAAPAQPEERFPAQRRAPPREPWSPKSQTRRRRGHNPRRETRVRPYPRTRRPRPATPGEPRPRVRSPYPRPSQPQPARLTGLAFAHGRNHSGAASPGELHRKPADHSSRARYKSTRGAAWLAPFRAAALRARRLPRTAAPTPAAAGHRRNVPSAASRELVAARCTTLTRISTRSPHALHRIARASAWQTVTTG